MASFNIALIKSATCGTSYVLCVHVCIFVCDLYILYIDNLFIFMSGNSSVVANVFVETFPTINKLDLI